MIERTATIRTERRLLLDGRWLETGRWAEVKSPYDGAPLAHVVCASAREARLAVDAAARAMERPLPAHERAAILERAAEALDRRAEDAAMVICAEAGKPIKAARVEVTRAISTYRHAAAQARVISGRMVPMDASAAGEGKLAFTLRVPVGVVGAIPPFNFPLNLVAHKIAPALAAGCAVVLKPAAQTPLSALLLAELEQEAGLPPGWLNVLVGPAAEIGDVLVADDRIKLITFTGSAQVGWQLRERAPRKRVSLELGNATPAIIEADADVEEAAAKLTASAFSFAGQSCISVQRIYVQRRIYEQFKASFLACVATLKVGDPRSEDTDVGPLISPAERDRVLAWIRESGGRILAGGDTTQDGLLRPTVVECPDPGTPLSCLEAFGPVCTIQPYDGLDEALALANGTRYGLQAGIFTRAIETAARAVQALDYGGVTVNETPTFRADQMPYGGVKDSGNTREGPAWTVRDMTEERLVVVQTRFLAAGA